MISFNNNWDDILKDEFDKQYYLELREFLIKEYKSHLIYPDKYKIFEALKLTDYEDVKIVILGFIILFCKFIKFKIVIL